MGMNSAKGFVVAGLIASFGGVAFGQTFVKPGETVEIPLPIANANNNGEPGGDTIDSMKVIVTGDGAFVTNPTESATQSIAPGAVKTFTPSFVVGQEAVEGQTYTVTLKMVSPDAGIDPDPDDPASDTQVSFSISRDPQNPRIEDSHGHRLDGVVLSTQCVFAAIDNAYVICTVECTGPDYQSKSPNFGPGHSVVRFGKLCGLNPNAVHLKTSSVEKC